MLFAMLNILLLKDLEHPTYPHTHTLLPHHTYRVPYLIITALKLKLFVIQSRTTNKQKVDKQKVNNTDMDIECVSDPKDERTIEEIINFTSKSWSIEPAIDKIYPLIKNRDPGFVKKLITTSIPLHYLCGLENDTKENCEIMRLIVLYGDCSVNRIPVYSCTDLSPTFTLSERDNILERYCTALHIASAHGNIKMVTELLKMGADSSITDYLPLRQRRRIPRDLCYIDHPISRSWSRSKDMMRKNIKKGLVEEMRYIFDNPPITYKTLAERKILIIVLNALVPLGTKAQVGEILKQLGWP